MLEPEPGFAVLFQMLATCWLLSDNASYQPAEQPESWLFRGTTASVDLPIYSS